MLRFRIHFRLEDGTEDSLVLSGATIEEIREQAEQEQAKRQWLDDAWSEAI